MKRSSHNRGDSYQSSFVFDSSEEDISTSLNDRNNKAMSRQGTMKEKENFVSGLPNMQRKKTLQEIVNFETAGKVSLLKLNKQGSNVG